ncbi:uncharacterized protein LOC141637624 [Silene latifolia]|uniref:uncharacterized protein LOC141637624 n=1 Tax=Silene latifolia TaxID=37657 RepID=UPI003D789EA5
MFNNSSFAFTSYGVKKDHTLTHRNRGIYTFRVQGQFYHFINDMLPTQEQPRYIQLYFFDTDIELWQRMQIDEDLSHIVVATLMRIMNANPYATFFRSLRKLNISEESRIVIRADPTHDQRTHNAPLASQVAAIWIEDGGSSEPLRHDIVVYARSGYSHHVLHYYACYDLLRYPLLFLNGDTGWHRRVYKYNNSRRRREPCSTFPINEILIQTADDLLEAEKKAANSSESKKKKILCREYYCYRLQICPNDSSILLRCGRLLQQYVVDMYIKLESTRLDFIRGNQSAIRAELYQGVIDSYNVGQTHGTHIGNSYILPASFTECGRDLRCRYLSSMSMVQRYGKPDIFLTMTCNPRWPEIEHELLPFEEAQNRPDLVTRVFRAKLIEVKKEIVEKKLFGAVDGYHMMHGPCGRDFSSNHCMKNGKCKNHYPRDYADITTNTHNSYPIYRKRGNGRSATVRDAQLDNRWVVPYNPFLLAKYDCHLNVEVFSTIKAVKYLYKYIYKGRDRVSFTVADDNDQHKYDEISAFQSARWISPPEAMWRIYRFCLNEIHPNVVTLQVHLQNVQTVLFRSFERLQNIAEDDARKKTMLTTFFKETRWILMYVHYYISNFQNIIYGLGKRMKRFGFQEEEALLLRSHIDEGFWRMMILSKTVWAEAHRFQMPFALRRLFATLLIYCSPKSPRLLWDRFLPALSEDYSLAFPEKPRKVLNLTLKSICYIIESMGKNFTDFDFRGLQIEDDEADN